MSLSGNEETIRHVNQKNKINKKNLIHNSSISQTEIQAWLCIQTVYMSLNKDELQFLCCIAYMEKLLPELAFR